MVERIERLLQKRLTDSVRKIARLEKLLFIAFLLDGQCEASTVCGRHVEA